jgi:glutamine phosphoribosylpyrophosphate amidotransferase
MTMLTFKQFLNELAREDATISPIEVEEMRKRFGDKVLQMGHLNEDGSMDVPVDCIVEAARSLEAHTLTEAAEIINNEQMVSMLQSGEALVERVGEARERKLRQMIRNFQNEGDTSTSHRQWKQIEKEVFGVDYND